MATTGETRIAVIGNSGGGKSTVARHLAISRDLPLVEVDALLWRPGWQLSPTADYERAHAEAIRRASWLVEGLGRLESIPDRLHRATEIILVDMPLEVHVRLASERHAAWEAGTLRFPPASMFQPPPLAALLETIQEVDRTWMPDIRRWVASAERGGTAVTRVTSLAELQYLGRDSL
ncbi:hypothetical protein [Falsiroseomonas sp. CW058]|uniref:hypothetical protein n=1 Tax=Falsiroseomonas sp. CW058 TaxID=3388664 RepID=UPI003D31BC23